MAAAFQINAFQWNGFQTELTGPLPYEPVVRARGDDGGDRFLYRGRKPYPWQEEPEGRKVRKKVTPERVEEALDEIVLYDLPVVSALVQADAAVVEAILPEWVWVPEVEKEDHQAVIEAIMRAIADMMERDDEEALMALLF